MSTEHLTVEPEQTKTDTWMVLDPANGIGPNTEILGTVEVPRFSQPTDDGVRLDRDKRLALAVARVVEKDDTAVRNGDRETKSVDSLDGWYFEVLTEIGADTEWATYEQNPAFDAVWDPEDES